MGETNIPGVNSTQPAPSILMPLPDHDFDPTEASIPWKVCTDRGWCVAISTEHGNVAQGDQLRLTGPLPGLVSVGTRVRAAYAQMAQHPMYQHPIPYAEIDPGQYQALLLPGGDAPGMRQYFESTVLQGKVLQFVQQGKLIGAICHGVLVLARTIDPQTGRSVLYGHKVTALPASLDRFAALVDAWWLKRGYITSSCTVEKEVRACLEHPDDFSEGPGPFTPYVLVDGNLVTSRWYYEADLFAERFAQALRERLHAHAWA